MTKKFQKKKVWQVIILLLSPVPSLKGKVVDSWIGTQASQVEFESFILTYLKTEIARSVRGPKLQGLLAEDVLVESYLAQKNCVT